MHERLAALQAMHLDFVGDIVEEGCQLGEFTIVDVYTDIVIAGTTISSWYIRRIHNTRDAKHLQLECMLCREEKKRVHTLASVMQAKPLRYK